VGRCERRQRVLQLAADGEPGARHVPARVLRTGRQIDDGHASLTDQSVQRGRFDAGEPANRRPACPPRSALQARIAHTADQHGNLPSHLREPGRRHVRPRAVVIGDHDPGASDRREYVGLLDQLPTRRRAKSRQMTCLVLFGGAHVESVQRALRVKLPASQRPAIDPGDARKVREAAGGSGSLCRRVVADVTESFRPAMIQREAGEGPSNRAVAQCSHPIGDRGVHERLRSDDAAGPAGAINDHQSLRIRCNLAHTQHEFAARNTNRSGNAHCSEFLESPRVQHDQILARLQLGVQFLGGDRGSMPPRFHQLTERLARDIHVAKQFAPGCAPGGEAATQQGKIRISQFGQLAGGPSGKSFAIVVYDDGHGPARNSIPDLQFQASRGQRSRKQRVGERKCALLPHIEQRDFTAIDQTRPHFVHGDFAGHEDKSQRFGVTSLE